MVDEVRGTHTLLDPQPQTKTSKTKTETKTEAGSSSSGSGTASASSSSSASASASASVRPLEEGDEPAAKKRRQHGGHRPLSEVWSIISDGSVPMVHVKPIIICRFCQCEVHTSAKPSRAILHLQRKCDEGRAYLDSIPEDKRTPFMISNFFVPSSLAPASVSTSGSTQQNAVQQPAPVSHTPVGFPSQSQQRFSQLLAMFFHSTDTPCSLVENPFLIAALEMCKPGITIPTKRQLTGKLLQDSCQKVTELLEKNGHEGLTEPVPDVAAGAMGRGIGRRKQQDLEKKAQVDFLRTHQKLLGQSLGVTVSAPAPATTSSSSSSPPSQEAEQVSELKQVTQSNSLIVTKIVV